jgi:hypothetical protein
MRLYRYPKYCLWLNHSGPPTKVTAGWAYGYNIATHGAWDPGAGAACPAGLPRLGSGKLFQQQPGQPFLSYTLFSGWYIGAPLPLDRYPIFATVSLFVAFGGSNIALPFLLDMFRFPADMFELFLVANVITNFFFTVVSGKIPASYVRSPNLYAALLLFLHRH